jgi:NAD-dependent dihydropyrimidine dehydrogenase PreA subunit/cation diffusion facilitator CzcD-associated flavoprotein CzcO
MGAEMRYGTPVTSLTALLDEGYDAVFVGSGAPRGKDLDIPGRRDVPGQVHIGIEWLANVHFKHVEKIEPRVIIIGVGNTAMDCCRTAKRLGATDVKVVARRGRRHFKASPWELEDAEEEQVEIVENHAPKRMLVENGRLVGMEFEELEWTEDAAGRATSRVVRTTTIPCDGVILAIGQDNAFPWIERGAGVEFDAKGMPVVDRVTHQSTNPRVFFGGDAAWGPQNIIWAVAHGHQAAISIDLHCHARPVTARPPEGMTLVSVKNGLHSWAYDNDYDASARQVMRHEELAKRFRDLNCEVELGFSPEQVATEVSRCLNCDIQTHFTPRKCIECDACIDVCPTNCLTITTNHSPEADLRQRLSAPAVNLTQEIYLSEALPQTQRVMVKDEDVCLHCGLCAERCPTAAWDMRLYDLIKPVAGAACEREELVTA